MKEQKGTVRERLLAIFGLIVIVIALSAAVVGSLYWVTGKVSLVGLRWWATLATLVLPVAIFATWRLGHTAAEEHLAGFDQGLDGAERTITSIGRGLSATASLARTAAQQARQAQPQWQVTDNSDLLPPMRMLPPQHDGGPVDL